ncbi:SUV3 ATP-dependent RNA helicase SUV3 [Candida maltosa Xu316]
MYPIICRSSLRSTFFKSLRCSYRYNVSARSGDTSIPKVIHTTTPSKSELIKQLTPIFDDLKQDLLNGKCATPYTVLNNQSNDVKLSAFEPFIKQIHKSLNDFQEQDMKSQDITLADFINPSHKRLLPLLECIQKDKIPNNFIQFCNLETKEELLRLTLLKLYYKTFLQHRIDTAPEEIPSLDFSNPAQWFPEARKMKRKIVMHVGPTNSGKTYNSLVKLSQSKTGYYAGPLRLLAREIFEKYNTDGIKCNLITGEEVVPSMDEFGNISGISSGTIEMIPLHTKMDLCVIDEIQMIANPQRGSVWTNAVLGVLAHEIHLCGEASAVPLIKKLVEVTGDELEVKHFKRLGKLTVEKTSTSLRELKKGDCLVVFSKRKIMDYKCKIEQQTSLKVGVIYGALPPEIRSQEAYKFNTGEYDVLVASDAIGMGLNLSIKRIVFSGISKFNGSEVVKLAVSDVRQIAGRAGRFSATDGSKEGFVSALQRSSLVYINQCLKEKVQPLEKACVWPTPQIWKSYIASIGTKFDLATVLKSFFGDVSTYSTKYFVSEYSSKQEILELIGSVPQLENLSIDDRLTLCECPISFSSGMKTSVIRPTIIKFFKNIEQGDCKLIFDFNFLNLDLLSQEPKIVNNMDLLISKVSEFEEMHKLVLVYLWLSQRYPTLFVDKDSAMEIKAVIEKRISQEFEVIEKVNGMIKRMGGGKKEFYKKRQSR